MKNWHYILCDHIFDFVPHHAYCREVTRDTQLKSYYSIFLHTITMNWHIEPGFVKDYHSFSAWYKSISKRIAKKSGAWGSRVWLDGDGVPESHFATGNISYRHERSVNCILTSVQSFYSWNINLLAPYVQEMRTVSLWFIRKCLRYGCSQDYHRLVAENVLTCP